MTRETLPCLEHQTSYFAPLALSFGSSGQRGQHGLALGPFPGQHSKHKIQMHLELTAPILSPDFPRVMLQVVLVVSCRGVRMLHPCPTKLAAARRSFELSSAFSSIQLVLLVLQVLTKQRVIFFLQHGMELT